MILRATAWCRMAILEIKQREMMALVPSPMLTTHTLPHQALSPIAAQLDWPRKSQVTPSCRDTRRAAIGTLATLTAVIGPITPGIIRPANTMFMDVSPALRAA